MIIINGFKMFKNRVRRKHANYRYNLYEGRIVNILRGSTVIDGKRSIQFEVEYVDIDGIKRKAHSKELPYSYSKYLNWYTDVYVSYYNSNDYFIDVDVLYEVELL